MALQNQIMDEQLEKEGKKVKKLERKLSDKEKEVAELSKNQNFNNGGLRRIDLETII